MITLAIVWVLGVIIGFLFGGGFIVVLGWPLFLTMMLLVMLFRLIVDLVTGLSAKDI